MKPRPWKLFHRTLILFVGLGIIPILIVALASSFPQFFTPPQYRIFTGILLIISTISTLCLAGLVVTILKRPIHQLLKAQQEIKSGNFSYHLTPTGSLEMQTLFEGFNDMASAVATAAEHEKQMAEDRSLAKVASQVVHDLRSPLASLKVACNYFEILPGSDPDHADYVKILRLSINRLRNIAEELLNQRKEPAKRSPTLLHDAINDLVTEIEAKKYTDLEIEIQFHQPAIPVSASKIEIQRAIGNIITNAIEAMQAIGKISIKTTDSNLGVQIHIHDNGPGMTDDVLQKVLRGGFTYGKANGNGVGMTVVREIVEKHRGALHAKSIVGRGTTFIIDWPLYDRV